MTRATKVFRVLACTVVGIFCALWIAKLVFYDLFIWTGLLFVDGPNPITHRLTGVQVSLPWVLLQLVTSVGLFVLCVRILIKTFKAR